MGISNMADTGTPKGPVGFVKGRKQVLTGYGSEQNDPCFIERKASTVCCQLHSRENCNFEIQNYTRCKRFWDGVKRERRHAGIKPHLPPLEEREQARQDYQHILNDLQHHKKSCTIL